MSRLRDLLALSDLARWNVVPTSRTQSVAQHSYRVAVIAREIYTSWEPELNAEYQLLEIIEWAMDHDGPECITGDLSSAFKDSISDLMLCEIEAKLCPWYVRASTVSSLTRSVVAIADTVEASAWLSVFGLTGTEPLVADLRQKALIRCDRANVKWPGLGAAGRQVAAEVWKNQFPLILRKERNTDNAAGSGTEDGRVTTNDSRDITNHGDGSLG